MFLVCLIQKWEIMGNSPARRGGLYLVFDSSLCGVFCSKLITYPQDAVLCAAWEQHVDASFP
jgi:hypothetical protein